MTTQDFSNKMTSALRDYLKSRGHIDTGDLYNSIKFTITENPFDIKLEAEPYIQYLDNGKFLENFINTSAVADIVDRYFIEYIDNLQI